MAASYLSFPSIVRYGGYDATLGNRYMVYNNGGTIDFKNSRLSNSYRFGLYQVSRTSTSYGLSMDGQTYGAYILDGAATFEGGGITSNTRGVQVIDGTVAVNAAVISGNSEFGVHASVSVDAENNYWGASSGPYHATGNPSGGGDDVSDNVDFSSFMADYYDLGADSVNDAAQTMKWTGSTTYSTNWANAVAEWNGLDPIVISQGTPADLTIQDYDDDQDPRYGFYYSGDNTVSFNEAFMAGLSSVQRDYAATHELGHALGLDHSISGNIMYDSLGSGTSLGPVDLFAYHYLWLY